MKSAETCLRCGNCCRHAGEVRLTDDEVEVIADFLGLSVCDFTDRHTKLRPDRMGLSLLERSDGACTFLGEPLAACLIHEAKPRQCREFPKGWRYDNVATLCRAWPREPSADRP
jgi:uncharacterized protein